MNSYFLSHKCPKSHVISKPSECSLGFSKHFSLLTSTAIFPGFFVHSAFFFQAPMPPPQSLGCLAGTTGHGSSCCLRCRASLRCASCSRRSTGTAWRRTGRLASGDPRGRRGEGTQTLFLRVFFLQFQFWQKLRVFCIFCVFFVCFFPATFGFLLEFLIWNKFLNMKNSSFWS